MKSKLLNGLVEDLNGKGYTRDKGVEGLFKLAFPFMIGRVFTMFENLDNGGTTFTLEISKKEGITDVLVFTNKSDHKSKTSFIFCELTNENDLHGIKFRFVTFFDPSDDHKLVDALNCIITENVLSR